MDSLRLIVGLGNPGSEYALTRHNVGFMALELLAERHQGGWKTEGRFESKVAWVTVRRRRVLCCEPQTFMNCSGRAVRGLSDFYKILDDRLLVVVDDADLPLGEVRMRKSGGSGGHHGLESVEQSGVGREYARLRIGIGRQPAGQVREITGHVLGRFQPEEQGILNRVLDRSVRQIECWATDGPGKAMNDFNGAIEMDSPTEQES
mgnify:CR=1 FL=1|jgi:peptidyl-tRNA hydrolase, PTH1 family